MKVLFAVHDEKVSSSIVRKYQKEYKEIISFKNVYYFNAILKELQRDKTYDRIVIDEELEEFTSSSFEQKDKYIFEKLDNITDEATNSRGNDIPIILIGSERRMKSEEFLIKLFGIGIYNALIGNDRSTDQVCKLINKPRLKKEAKAYYRIDSDEAGYQPEKIDDVSEEEMQHILSYFKRLGKNEERYIECFRNIVSQYNDKQMRIIISILPEQIKDVLEQGSPEYQRLTGKRKGTAKSGGNSKGGALSGTSEKLLTNKQANSGRPIVVPSRLEKTLVKKIEPEKKSSLKPKIEDKVDFEDDILDNSMFDDFDDEEVETNVNNLDNNTKSMPEFEDVETTEKVEVVPEPPKKRGRGRPRKNPLPETTNEVKVPKKRGRPRKNPLPEEQPEASALPGFDDDDENESNVGNAILPAINDLEEYEAKNREEARKLEEIKRASQEEEKLPGFDDLDDDETLPGFEDLDDDDDDLLGYDNLKDDDDEDDILPGFDDEEDEETMDSTELADDEVLPGFEDDEDDEPLPTLDDLENENQLPGFDDEDEDEAFEEVKPVQKQNIQREMPKTNPMFNHHKKVERNSDDLYTKRNSLEKNEFEDYDYSEYNSLLSSSKKVMTFVGTSKNGTSFIVNNIAKILADAGIDTAILDATKNKNAYYIYTKNEEDLRQTATRSVRSLVNGNPEGIRVKNNLTVYTEPPTQESSIENVGPILENLIKNHSAVLIDCDFDTPIQYFENSQEIYLVQSMDVLTIQPFTAFLRDLKAKDIIDKNKIKIIINKSVRIRGVTAKTIVGGMAFYNDPEMSFMTELFDRNAVVPIEIPFDMDVYERYLEEIIECEISVDKYPKEFQNILSNLAAVVYPLLPARNTRERPKRGYQYSTNYSNNGFSDSMNNTLNNMRKKMK